MSNIINVKPQDLPSVSHQHNHIGNNPAPVSILAQRVSDDLNTGRLTASRFKNSPPVLSIDSAAMDFAKRLNPQELNVLNSVKNSKDLLEFVDEHISNFAKKKNVTLDRNLPTALRTSSSFLNKPTQVYFSHQGTNSEGKTVIISLSLGDAQMSKITPEVMGVIAKSFNVESDMNKQLCAELDKKNSEMSRVKSENITLQDKNKFLNEKTEELQRHLDTLSEDKKNCEHRLSQLQGKVDVSEHDLKHLKEEGAKLNDEITRCKTELDSAKKTLQTNQQEINTQAQHLLKLGKRSYWPTALAGVASAVALVFMGIKAAGLNSAEDDLKDADNDDNYVKQGNDARDAAVTKQIEEDSAAYVQALKDDTVDTQEIQEIIARYNVDSSGAPQFGAETLSDVGKPYMEEKGEKGRVEGVQKAKTEAIEKAQHTVDQAKESVGLLGGAAGLSLLLTGGFFTYARSKNKHLVATEKSINQALAENKPFKAPEEKGFVKFTGTINRFVSGNRAPASATLISR